MSSREAFARQLRRLERKLDDARDEIEELKGELSKHGKPNDPPPAKKEEDEWT